MRNFDNDPNNGNWHTVPYTNRTRFISQPISAERRAGEQEFEKRKIYFNIIPYDDPIAIRVTDILKKNIHALHTEMNKMSSVSYASWSHLDGLNWEVLIINEAYIETYTHAGGKIVTTAASIRGYTDQQLATLLAHEVCSGFLVYYSFCT
ncbi:mitochondrial metalloendopeptidase OMA1 [Trifolium repens]|nr:mitochondrial metalloendopeptidase OMA1 [Trifolium repens]